MAAEELERLVTTWLVDCQYSSMKRHDARYIVDQLKANPGVVLRALGGQHDPWRTNSDGKTWWTFPKGVD